MKLKFSVIRQVKLPNKAHKQDCGIDFFVPKNTNDYCTLLDEKNIIHNQQGIWVNGNSRIMIPSGIKCNVPNGYVLIAFDKSGIASSMGLISIGGVIDPGYQGQIVMVFYNTNHYNVCVPFDSKILQYICLPMYMNDMEIVDESKLFQNISERGCNGFGSTQE